MFTIGLQSPLITNNDKNAFDLVIRVISRKTRPHGDTFEEMTKDLSSLFYASHLIAQHFQFSFDVLLPWQPQSNSAEFFSNLSRFIDLCSKRHCVIKPDSESGLNKRFLVKSRNWNFIECVDCKWDTDCPLCLPHFYG